MRDRGERELSARLRAAIEVLKESSDAGASWRTELLQRIGDDRGTTRGADVIPLRPRATPGRRWTVRPLAALAAGISCALVGAATSALILLGHGRAPTSDGIPDVGASSLATNVGEVLPVRFTLVAPGAAQVSLVGDFNRWDPVTLPLRRGADGRTWEVEVRLPPGRYGYSFVVDGRLARDPTAPQDVADEYGSPNSVLLLRGS